MAAAQALQSRRGRSWVGPASSFRPPLKKLTGELVRHRERRRGLLLRQVDQMGHVFAALAITNSLEQIVGGMEQGIGTRDLIAEVTRLAEDIERRSRG